MNITLTDIEKKNLISFLQEIIQIPSYSTKEKEVVERIKKEMINLGYDNILEDSYGSVIGVIGQGDKHYLFDSHIDTVEVTSPQKWTYPPFGGEIHDNKIYGRGASDMKASAAAGVYAGALMKKHGLLENKTIYICCSAIEEDFDGVGTKNAILENNLQLDGVIICEPTHLKISIGQKGRSVFTITTKGKSSHGAAPEKGENAVYKMANIIDRVHKLSHELMNQGDWHGNVVLSKIESTSVSINAVPDECKIYLDRRTTLTEDEAFLTKEMNQLVDGTDAFWEVYTVKGKSYKDADISMRSVLPAWEISVQHELTKSLMECYRTLYEKEPELYRWDFSTNGVSTAGELHIPTIGFGAGIEKMAHQTDEYCPVEDVIKACEFYINLPRFL